MSCVPGGEPGGSDPGLGTVSISIGAPVEPVEVEAEETEAEESYPDKLGVDDCA